jgi:hypothetical protein
VIRFLAEENFGPAQAIIYLIGIPVAIFLGIWLLVWVFSAQRKKSKLPKSKSSITHID